MEEGRRKKHHVREVMWLYVGPGFFSYPASITAHSFFLT